MAIGETKRELFLPTNPSVAFQVAQQAGNICGSVKETDPTLNSLTIKTNFFLQTVKLRIDIRPQEGGSLLSIQGFSDDLWGGGARRGIDKFLKAVQQMKLPDAIASVPPPLPTSDTKYYIFVNEQVHGPFSGDQITALRITRTVDATTPCCLAGSEDWFTIQDYIH